ncbi:MAG: hypothetical protein IJ214_05365, partial [Clostridia bacterium]|nr:hypothetical protein [Clostridia bacterium]
MHKKTKLEMGLSPPGRTALLHACGQSFIHLCHAPHTVDVYSLMFSVCIHRRSRAQKSRKKKSRPEIGGSDHQQTQRR